jgi:hypothetical protein
MDFSMTLMRFFPKINSKKSQWTPWTPQTPENIYGAPIPRE